MPRPAQREIKTAVILLGLLIAAGCRTTVGNYLGNRARDLGEVVRVQTGLGVGVGATVKTAGLLRTGLAVAAYPRALGVGWDYGRGYAFGLGKYGRGWDAEVDMTPGSFGLLFQSSMVFGGHPPVPPGPYLREGAWEGPARAILPPTHWEIRRAPEIAIGREHLRHGCWAIVPGLIALVGHPVTIRDHPPQEGVPPPRGPEAAFVRGPEFLWRERKGGYRPWDRVHAFDVDASVYAGIVYVRVGFSPGELVDFVLGWFGADIADDDRAIEERRPDRNGGQPEPERSPSPMEEIWEGWGE